MWWILAPFRYLVIAPLRLLNSIFRMVIIIIAIVGAFFIGAHFASALSFPANLDCTYFSTVGGGASCSGSTITLVAGGGGSLDAADGITLPMGVTYYVSFVASGSGTGAVNCAGNAVDGSPTSFTSGSNVDLAINCPSSGNSWNSVFIQDNSSFSGTVTDICVATAGGDCTGPPPPPPVSSSGSILPSLFLLISVFLCFLVLIRFAKPTERFIANLSPSRFVQRLFGRNLRGRRRWYE